MKIIHCLLLIFFFGIFSSVSFGAVEVIGSTVHKHIGIAGDTYTGTIKIYNVGDSDQEVRIYQTDYLFNFEGKSFYEKPVSHPRSNAGWLEFSPKSPILKAKETRIIQYEIKIPANDSLTGTYWSLMMVEGVKSINPDRNGQLNINTSTRYAVQLITQIGNTGIGELRFMKPSLTADAGNVFLDVVMENTGERLISPVVTAEFFDENGRSVKVFKAPKNGMYPTCSSLFRFNIEGIEGKKTYQVLIIADGGNDDVFGLETTLNF